MICKNCGKETSTVMCENCGINVVWFNKYGCLENVLAQKDIDLMKDLESEYNNKYDYSDIEDIIDEIFIPDGSGD